MHPQGLQVSNLRLGVVVDEAAAGRGRPTAPLVEQDDAVVTGVEEAPGGGGMMVAGGLG